MLSICQSLFSCALPLLSFSHGLELGADWAAATQAPVLHLVTLNSKLIKKCVIKKPVWCSGS